MVLWIAFGRLRCRVSRSPQVASLKLLFGSGYPVNTLFGLFWRGSRRRLLGRLVTRRSSCQGGELVVVFAPVGFVEQLALGRRNSGEPVLCLSLSVEIRRIL